MKEIKTLFKSKKYLKHIAFGAVLVVLAAATNLWAGSYVDSIQTYFVADIAHEILPFVDLSFVFIYGIALVGIVFAYYSFKYHPEKVPLFLYNFAALYFFRAFCITLTHLGTPVSGYDTIVEHVDGLFWHNDLFFSGHTAFTFTCFLLAEKKNYKIGFLISSVIMVLTVLLMRVHYSIDIIGGYFIAFGIYYLVNKYLKRFAIAN